MRVKTRRLFALILLAQLGCVAVGLSIYHLYVSSALAQAQQDEARVELARQLQALCAELDGHDLAWLKRDPQALRSLFAHWEITRDADDGELLVLDASGNVTATSDLADKSLASDAKGPLKLTRASASWGAFGDPIRGNVKLPDGQTQIALAQGLPSRDGYVLMTRSADAQKVSSAAVESAMWMAGGITLLWTIALQAATVSMIISYCTQEQSRVAAQPEVEALRQAQALVRTQETVIFGLAKLSDSRDADTGSHLERIAHYSSALAAALRPCPEFRDQITPGFVQLIGLSSALHDIGKVGVEDSILRKPGLLTAEERARMQRHTQIGEECLMEIERRLGSSNFLQMAREISSAHHEQWDGGGYPLGLSGEQIPLSARIVALADVYDALSQKRVYKNALPHDECVALIAEAAGTHFDPRVVDVFLQIHNRFLQISEQFDTPARASKNESAATTGFSPLSGVSQYVIDNDFAMAGTSRYFEPESSPQRPGPAQ